MAVSRRAAILKILAENDEPVSGSVLAQRLRVSRQVIVQDVAVLRASGEQIAATRQGYVLSIRKQSCAIALLACQHSEDQAEDEMNALIDAGVRIIDVVVEHALYGELRGRMMITSPEDIRDRVHRLRETGDALLSSLTGGVHSHTIEADDVTCIERAQDAMRRKGYLLHSQR